MSSRIAVSIAPIWASVRRETTPRAPASNAQVSVRIPMLRRLYDCAMGLAESRHAPAGLFAVSFAESSFFPIPPDVMLAPMVLAKPQKAYVYAALCTLASVLGGIAGYA